MEAGGLVFSKRGGDVVVRGGGYLEGHNLGEISRGSGVGNNFISNFILQRFG